MHPTEAQFRVEHADNAWRDTRFDANDPDSVVAGRTLFETAVTQLRYHSAQAMLVLYQASMAKHRHVIAVLCDMPHEHQSVCELLLSLLLEAGIEQRVPGWQWETTRVFNWAVERKCVGLAMRCTDWGAAMFSPFQSRYTPNDEGMREIRLHVTHLHRRQAHCCKTLVALLGCCGRWRGKYGGALRDPIHEVAQNIWTHARRHPCWPVVVTPKRIKVNNNHQ